jgi:DNA-binding CsgD family transcriptional regulator
MPLKAIAEQAGVHPTVVGRLLRGATPNGVDRRMHRGIAAGLLAVELGEVSTGLVPVAGSRRRLQALIADGHGPERLAVRLGMTRQAVHYLLNVATRVSAVNALAIRDLYLELRDRPPTPTCKGDRVAIAKALSRARRGGFLSSWAWDDDTIDDPAAQPVEWERTGRDGLKLGEDVAFLVDPPEGDGMSLEAAADYLGVKFATAEKALHRWRMAHADVDQLRADNADGVHVDQLAADTGLRPGEVFGLLLGTAAAPVLTDAMRDACELACDGLDDDAIAARLGTSAKAVRDRLYRSYHRLGIRGRAQLADVDLDATRPLTTLPEPTSDRRSA